MFYLICPTLSKGTVWWEQVPLRSWSSAGSERTRQQTFPELWSTKLPIRPGSTVPTWPSVVTTIAVEASSGMRAAQGIAWLWLEELVSPAGVSQFKKFILSIDSLAQYMYLHTSLKYSNKFDNANVNFLVCARVAKVRQLLKKLMLVWLGHFNYKSQ